MRYRYLSHILDEKVPVYGGEGSIRKKRVKSIVRGDSANTYDFSMGNHWGTHIDFPNHFFEYGARPVDYPPDFWVFKSPVSIRVSLDPSEILGCGKWLRGISAKNDILLLQSGWRRKRGRRPYSFENPGIDPEVGFYLRKNYPNLRTIGIDWISISPYRNRRLGGYSHRALLSPEGNNAPILIVEDMDLPSDLKALRQVYIFPFRIAGIDSSPCTAIGCFDD